MGINTPDFRPLGAPSHIGRLAVRLRQGALCCTRCKREFQQHDVQGIEDGMRFVCDRCGLDLLEIGSS
jgi:hypothetical protein